MENAIIFGVGFYCGWVAGVLGGVVIGAFGPRILRWMRERDSNKSDMGA